MRELYDLLALAVRLWRQCWPQLLLIAACGAIANDLLLPAAVQAGFVNGLAGLAVLSLVVLTKLVVVVLMFLALRPYMPAVATLQPGGGPAPSAGAMPQGGSRAVYALIAIAIIPFFAYYAAWGFLGDTVREYSLLALDMRPFGERAVILDIPDSQWLFASIALSWVVRRFAKAMRARGSRPIGQFVIVICDANWVFVGLYVLSRWKDAAWAWLAAGGPIPYLIFTRDLLSSWISTALAATPVPVELAEPPLAASAQSLLLYALLPLVWLLMAAVIYGCDMSEAAPLTKHRRISSALSRYSALPRFLRDFIDHFVSGYRSRYVPVVNSVRLAFGASLPVLLGLIVLYRAIGWGGAWAWIGLSRLIGPHDLTTWQALASPIALLLGGPSDIRGGIVVDALRICLLAAVMEQAVGARLTRNGEVRDSAQSEGNADAQPAG
ncbi:hypothetical protein [Bosea sp. BK604]|uniref:hypothetical protein n=1 Tax=Bosea sp. BK604 TaxID=2512180 RepID=UPI0010539D0E|nr:hypothetical protein [Bosea sp. BK604]TCR67591.1 hypothetical protein EV560_103655 [Bosea sp. BK604]